MISLLSKSTPGLATIHSIWADGCETKRPQMRAVGGAIASYPDRRGRRQRVFGGVVGRSMSRHPCSSCERAAIRRCAAQQPPWWSFLEGALGLVWRIRYEERNTGIAAVATQIGILRFMLNELCSYTIEVIYVFF